VSNEIDRFMGQAVRTRTGYGTSRVGASYREPPKAALKTEQAKELLTKKVDDVLVSLFGQRDAWDRVAAVCGRSPRYWETSLAKGREKRAAIRELVVGLRAHITGVRDHLNDVERDLLAASSLADLGERWK
jgi:hypothetical protein